MTNLEKIRYLARNPENKVLRYLDLLLCEVTPLKENFFTNDQNWLNQKLVKWGWGWTLYSLLAMSFIINLTEEQFLVSYVVLPLAKLM